MLRRALACQQALCGHPGVVTARPIRRVTSLRYDSTDTQPAGLFEHTQSATGDMFRIADGSAPVCMPDEPQQLALSTFQRHALVGFATHEQQIEDEIDQTAAGSSGKHVLQRLEACSTVRPDDRDFAVEERLPD